MALVCHYLTGQVNLDLIILTLFSTRQTRVSEHALAIFSFVCVAPRQEE